MLAGPRIPVRNVLVFGRYCHTEYLLTDCRLLRCTSVCIFLYVAILNTVLAFSGRSPAMAVRALLLVYGNGPVKRTIRDGKEGERNLPTSSMNHK